MSGWEQVSTNHQSPITEMYSLFLKVSYNNAVAQSKKQSVEFDEIQCRSLKIVDSEGKTVAMLEKSNVILSTIDVFRVFNSSGKIVYRVSYDPNGGFLAVSNGTNNLVSIGIDDQNKEGFVSIYGKDGKGVSQLSVYEYGGGVFAKGKDGQSQSQLAINEYGGVVSAKGKDGQSQSHLAIDEFGGVVSAKGKDGQSQSHLAIDEFGGAMAIFNKAGQNCFQASIGDMGGGIITTRDKLGYRTGNLP